MTYLGPVGALEYIHKKLSRRWRFLRPPAQCFCEPIVSSLWFAQKITLRLGDSFSPRKVQLTLSLDPSATKLIK